MATAHFRTGMDQYVLTLDAKVGAALVVGELVTYTASTNTIAKASTVDAATHIVALSDMTIAGGHVNTDEKNYASSDAVAASTTVTKKVGLYPIFDKADVIVD